MTFQLICHFIDEMNAILDESAIVVDSGKWITVEISFESVMISRYRACAFRVESNINKKIVLFWSLNGDAKESGIKPLEV